jgi:membrane associated rhomboid family serine protease
VLAYLLEIRHGGSFLGGPADSALRHHGALPRELTHSSRPAAWRSALTSLFTHASFVHLLGDVAFLAIFGPTVEDAVGRARFAALYLLGGLVALGVQVAVYPASTVPVLGASGAVAAVLGGYLLLHPRARVLSLVLVVFFFTLVEVPAVLLLAFWFAQQLYVDLAGLTRVGGGPVGSGGVAFLAQACGFAVGLLVIRPLARRARGAPALPVIPA